ncbi:hypothetical protein [Clostridium senegalense]|nr:hypothetical protein [Clostridium senegalense]
MSDETGSPVSFELNGVKLEVERKIEESLAAKCTTITRRTGVPK